jgi:AhpD family alkylhydroperoxidase
MHDARPQTPPVGDAARPASDQHGPRIDYTRVSPAAIRAQLDMEAYVRTCGLEMPLIELVKLRASQINGCAYCVDMHTKEARAAGESEQRLYAIPVWRETPFFSARERAALEWTEAVTRLGHDGVPDELFALARTQFTDDELVNLTMAVIAINAWNRLAVTFQADVGSYQPALRSA